MTTETTTTAYALVGITRGTNLAAMTKTGGYTDDSRLEIIRANDLAAICTTIDPAGMTGDRGERNLGDISWLTPRVVRHDEILAAATDLGPVMPVAFGSVFSSPESVTERLTRNADAITRFLDKIDAAAEFALTLAATPEAVRAAEQPKRTAASGADYLRSKLKRDEPQRSPLADATSTIAATLRPLALDAVARKIVRAETDEGHMMLANWAFLVADDGREAFENAIADEQATRRNHGLLLTLTGPWPAYSFCPSLA
ncbi:MAG: GvpL/GvpF family gas vesicle protein [Planctomycetota bacterium]